SPSGTSAPRAPSVRATAIATRVTLALREAMNRTVSGILAMRGLRSCCYDPLDAHRHLERQLAEGAPREGRVVARAREAGRPLDAGDQAQGRGRAGAVLRERRLQADPSRRGPLERRRDRESRGRERRGHEL